MRSKARKAVNGAATAAILMIKYSALDQINKGNVSQLRIGLAPPGRRREHRAKLRAPTIPRISATLIMVDGFSIPPTVSGSLKRSIPAPAAPSAEQPFADERIGPNGTSTRHQLPPEGNDKRIYAIRGDYLIALDAATGSMR
jgi:hypothetical protein